MTKSDILPNPESIIKTKQSLRDADTCTAIGLGVGALGIGTAVVAGAVCPLCYFVAPGLIALGIGKRIVTKRRSDVAAGENDNCA